MALEKNGWTYRGCGRITPHGFRMRQAAGIGLLALAVSICGGCRRAEEPDGAARGPGPSADTRQVQRDRATAAREDLFQQLSSRLKTVINEQGPAAAIRVCSEEASEITARVGSRHGVTMGRTSFKLRNAANAPPAWSQSLVAQKIEQPQFIDLPQGGLGALLPIRLQGACLLCHGRPEEIPKEVREVLAEKYPNDQATGFAENELRGWFWVEVPAL